MRKRLREKYSDEMLANIYKQPHNHISWEDHKFRVQVSIGLLKPILPLNSAADLSAGDATIINSLDIDNKYIGDFASGYEYQGPIEKTIDEIPSVDLFICSETIEHLDDPDTVLNKIREKTKWLLLTTPNGENNDSNPEHYWGWDTEGIEDMLKKSGFSTMMLNTLRCDGIPGAYNYQMWLAK